MALYDVGRLYDTIPSNFYNDKSYTPNGKNRWGTERYNRKVENIVAVIDSMNMPIVALFGVENEEVVRDIVMHSKQDYSYIHRTIDYYDGLDFAILYYGDRLFVERISSTNHTMIVRGEIGEESISFHLARVGGRLRSTLPDDGSKPTDINIVWGRLSRDDLKRLKMDDPLRKAERAGYGESMGKLSWEFQNRVGVTLPKQSSAKCGVYITEWLLTSDSKIPLSTISDGRYWGGYSSHLPLYLYINTTPKGED